MHQPFGAQANRIRISKSRTFSRESSKLIVHHDQTEACLPHPAIKALTSPEVERLEQPSGK